MASKRGFTMIELLMVIAIVAILGATALPQFLDFRNEARASMVRKSLASMRVAIKNAMHQARLRCGRSFNTDQELIAFNHSLEQNNLTAASGSVPGTPLCTTAQLPNAVDRQIIDLSNAKRAVISGTARNLPDNPFFVDSLPGSAMGVTHSYGIAGGPDDAAFAPDGTPPCNLAAIGISSINGRWPWAYNMRTSEIYATTNTPGINECSF